MSIWEHQVSTGPVSSKFCLHSPHLCLLLCLGRRFTLQEIRQPLLCFVEWIKTWKRDYKSDSPSNNINYPYQGHRYHQEILKICCPSDHSLANLSNKRVVIIAAQIQLAFEGRADGLDEKHHHNAPESGCWWFAARGHKFEWKSCKVAGLCCLSSSKNLTVPPDKGNKLR